MYNSKHNGSQLLIRNFQYADDKLPRKKKIIETFDYISIWECLWQNKKHELNKKLDNVFVASILQFNHISNIKMDERNTRTLKVQLSQNVNNSERERKQRERKRERIWTIPYTLALA
jgi:hypothetical protein